MAKDKTLLVGNCAASAQTQHIIISLSVTVGQHLYTRLCLQIILMEEAIKDMQDSIQSFQTVQQSILDRLQSIENSGCKPKSNAGSSNDSDDQSSGLKTHYGVKSLQQAVASHSPANKGAAAANSQADSVDRVDSSVQDEYQGIKDKVASIKIPQELRCGTSKAGIRREDSNATNIIFYYIKCSYLRYYLFF